MSKEEFEYLMYVITANTVAKIAAEHGWSDDEALEKFVRSKVYAVLENEESKAWHLSTTLLARLFNDEQAGHLVWPEVA